MANLGYTLGEAEEYATMRLAAQMVGRLPSLPDDSLFEDSEREAATGDHPPQSDVGRSPPRQRRTPAPSYDPRSAPWPEDY